MPAEPDLTLAHHIVRAYLPPETAEVWLFDSRARGDGQRGSEIGIAVLPKGELPTRRYHLESPQDILIDGVK